MTPRSIDREGSVFTTRELRDTFSLEPLETRTFLSAAIGGEHEGVRNDAHVFASAAPRYAAASSATAPVSGAASDAGQRLVFGRRAAAETMGAMSFALGAMQTAQIGDITVSTITFFAPAARGAGFATFGGGGFERVREITFTFISMPAGNDANTDAPAYDRPGGEGSHISPRSWHGPAPIAGSPQVPQQPDEPETPATPATPVTTPSPGSTDAPTPVVVVNNSTSNAIRALSIATSTAATAAAVATTHVVTYLNGTVSRVASVVMDAGAVAVPAKALGTFGGAGIDLAAIGRSLTFRTGIGKPAEDVLTATNVADALAADGVSHARMMIASAAGAVANEAAQLARGMLDTMFPPRQVFQIQQLGNPANLIGDALAAFADESVIATATRGTNDSRIVRAWTITGVVAAIDVAVLAAWARSKAKKRRVYAATLAAQDTA